VNLPISFFLFFLGFFYSSDAGSDTRKNEIVWTDGYKLSWNDFKGIPDRRDDTDALTSVSIYFSYTDNSKNHLDITIFAAFDKQESWLRRNKGSEYLLSHEQLHFDITELFARKLRKEVYAFHQTSRSIKRDYDYIFNQVYNELQRMQVLYDKETHHSLDKQAQTSWQKKIADMLEAYRDYKESNFSILLRH